jgi:hypothetical protein
MNDAREPSTGRLLVIGIVGLILLRAALLGGVFAAYPRDLPRVFGADAIRYRQIAGEPGRPYRDFEVEFPPVSLLAIEAVAGPTARSTGIRLGATQLALDAIVAGALAWGWGGVAALAYLLLGLPLVPFVYFRLDLLSVALATGAMLLIKRGKERAGGLTMAAAVLAKVWPLALIPIMVAEGRKRALRWTTGALLAGGGLWFWAGGLSGFRQVATLRGAKGWQVESLVGSFIRVVSNPKVILEAGADRVGSADLWARALLLIGAAVVIGIAARLTRVHLDLADSVSSATVVACLMIASPILSPQYLTWLLPWVAIGLSQGERIQAELLALALLLTAIVIYNYGLLVAGEAPLLGMALLRDLLLAGMIVVGLIRLTGRRLEALSAPDRAP